MRQRRQGENPYAQYYEQQRRQQYLFEIRQKDPKRFQRIMKIHDLANDYRRANDPARKAEIEKQLRPLLDEELRAQQQDAKERVAAMEKKLDNIKKLLKQRDEHWNEVVDFNFKKVTGESDYLEFTLPPEPGRKLRPRLLPLPKTPKSNCAYFFFPQGGAAQPRPFFRDVEKQARSSE